MRDEELRGEGARGFGAILAAAERRDYGLAVTIPEDWHQGRTAYGGFSAAIALAGAMRLCPEGALPPLRSSQISFVGPLYGTVEVRARLLRRGKNASWIAADIVRDGEVGLTASFVFMGPVESSLHLNGRPLPAGLIAPELARDFAMKHSPAFLRHHFDVRFALPRGEERHPELCWWIRLREADRLDPTLALQLCADALPPGVLPLLHPGVPVSSMTWLCNQLAPLPETRNGWWLLRSTGDYAEKGCASQRMDIWNADGAPMMTGMQSVAIFG